VQLDDWQDSVLFDSLRLRPDSDLWAAREVALIVSRQNGKNGVLLARQLIGMYVLGERLQTHSAHRFETCEGHFTRLQGVVENAPKLMKQVRIIRLGSGTQAVELKSGEVIKFVARGRGGGRGLSPDVVYFDEAFELPVSTIGAMLPSLSAMPNPQIWYSSSAPHFHSEYLHQLRERGRSADPGRLMFREWGNEPDVRPDDRAAWRRANPALGIRITEDFIEGELDAMSKSPEGMAEFRRERLGIAEGGDGAAGLVPYSQWESLGLDAPPRQTDSVCYGLDVASDGSFASVASAGRLPDGKLYVDNVHFASGTDWVVGYLANDLFPRRKQPIRVDSSGTTGVFIDQLREAGVTVEEVAFVDYRRACGELLQSIETGRLAHLDQPCLNRAVRAAGKRDVGKEGAWVWSRPGPVDISPLKAATLAMTGVRARRVSRMHVYEGA
jgi:phage terminase large subunit-like protein